MTRLSITFERSEDDAPHGFELGQLTVTTPAGTVTSKGRTPDQSMMIYLAFVDLMTGMSSLLRGIRGYDFVGADSSFTLRFTRIKDDVAIHQGKTNLGSVPLSELATCVCDEATRFWAAHPLDGIRQRARRLRARARATEANALERSAGPVEDPLGASPQAEPTLEGVGVVAEANPSRQLREPHGVAAADDHVVRLQGRAQGLDDGVDLFAPFANAQALETLQADVVFIGAPFLYGRWASSIGCTSPLTTIAEPSPVPRPRKSMRPPR